MRRLLFVLGLLLVAGCAGSEFTTEQSLAVACRGYPATLQSLTPYKSEMSPEQVAVIDQAVAIIGPACKAAAEAGTSGEPIDAEAILNLVRAELRKLLIMEGQMS